MLNEIWRLKNALERCGRKPRRKHDRVRTPGRSHPCLRVRLGPDGGVMSVDCVPKDDWPAWTLADGNQNSFPVVRIHPVAPSPAGTELEDALSRPANVDRSLWGRLREKAAELAGCASRDDALAAVGALAVRFRLASDEPERLLREVAEKAVAALRSGKISRGDLPAVEALVFGRKGKGEKDTVQLAFDIDGLEDCPRVYGPQAKERLIDLLPASGGGRGTDAFTGEQADLESKYPIVELPGWGSMPITSMNANTPCNRRYGMSGAGTFPLSTTAGAGLKEALEYITEDEREGATWRRVANGRRDPNGNADKDLLIVFSNDAPVIDAGAARCFGQGRAEAAAFDADAEAVCAALRGVVTSRPDSRLELILLRRVSKGQVRVVLSESLAARDMLDAAERWRAASRDNLPDIAMQLPSEKGKQYMISEPTPPYPGQVVQLLSCEWNRGGTHSVGVRGPEFRDALDMMLRTPGRWRAAAGKLLDLTVLRIGPLLQGVAGADRRGEKTRFRDYPRAAREAALCAAAVLGIALDSLGRKREAYMNDTAFKLGQLLALTDTLHLEYCRHVRHGNVPPQLIGGSLMPAAADNPEDAIDRLRERSHTYLMWAKTLDGKKKENRLAMWAVGKMGGICRDIAESLPTQTDRAFRAELLLGYLARARKPEGQPPDGAAPGAPVGASAQ